MNIAILDTENTSKYAHNAELIEVAATLVSVDHRGDEEGHPTVVLDECLGEYSSLNQPSIPIPQDVVDLTGITDGLVAGHRLDMAGLAEFLRPADLVVAHNAAYDRPILERYGLPPMRWACSLKMIDWPYQLTGASLEALARRFRLPYPEQNAHRAMADVQVLSWLLGCSSLWEHRRKHPTFLAELLESAATKRAVAVVYGAPKPWELAGPSAKAALEGRRYRFCYDRKAWFSVVAEDALREERDWVADTLFAGSRPTANNAMRDTVRGVDITTDFERALGLQPEEVAA